MLRTHILLSEYASYKIGGPADYFCEPKNIDELMTALTEAQAKHIPIFILGGGTNLLISDAGIRGLVVRLAFQSLRREGNAVIADAGISMERLLSFATKQGLSGLEWAGGLPGTVGGAIRGNAGAFGGEIKDSVLEVQSLVIGNGEPRLMRRTDTECHFGYRASIFKELQGKEIILSAAFALVPGDPEAIRRATEEKIRYRKERHPLEYPNVGSIFKNVPLAQINANIEQIDADTIRVNQRKDQSISAFTVPVKKDPFPVIPTAFLISEAGLKGVSRGKAMVSPKHPNFIVNMGGATANDVKELIQFVKKTVREKFGIELEEEVMYV